MNTSMRRGARPTAMIPFEVDYEEASFYLSHWLKNAPCVVDELQNLRTGRDGLKGIYLPYWTFDSRTTTQYTGKRGTGPKGRESWEDVSGVAQRSFNDLMVPASRCMPRENLDALEPWLLDKLEPIRPDYVAGFTVEASTMSLEQAFELARPRMDDKICDTIGKKIGGTDYRITSRTTTHTDIRFRYILLPVWLGVYRHEGKLYRVVINARSGEVHGDPPPRSVTKVAVRTVKAYFIAFILVTLFFWLQILF